MKPSAEIIDLDARRLKMVYCYRCGNCGCYDFKIEKENGTIDLFCADCYMINDVENIAEVLNQTP